jgi:hypothetical protein
MIQCRLVNLEINSSSENLKKTTVTERVRLNRLQWFGHAQRMYEYRIPKILLYMNLETTRLRGRPRNRWQNETRKGGRIVGGEGLQELYNRKGWKKLLRKASSCCILYVN